jgi:glycerate kinase
LAPGIELMLELMEFSSRLTGADLVVTGEGSLDDQTLRGKAPAGVAAAARAAGIPVVAVCGRSLLSETEWRSAGFTAVYPLSAREPDVRISMERAADLLFQIGAELAADLVWLLAK